MSLLTVGIPVYNAMQFLPDTISSLISQSYVDFDILIINDGSTDDSADYLNSLTGPRIQVIHQENLGLTTTLNRMLNLVRTPWLVRQDADDVAYPDRIKKTIEWINRYPDAGMFYSLADYCARKGGVGSFRTTVAEPEVLRAITRAGYTLSICHPTVCLNVEKTLKLGGYRFDLHVEDIDLWWRMALEYDVRLIPDVLLGVRHNSGSISQSNLKVQSINSLYIQYLLISHLWDQDPSPYEEITHIIEAFLDLNHLKFRERMRQANIALGSGKWFGAALGMANAFTASPSSFAKRLTYEFSANKSVVNGIDPLLFAFKGNELWRRKDEK